MTMYIIQEKKASKKKKRKEEKISLLGVSKEKRKQSLAGVKEKAHPVVFRDTLQRDIITLTLRQDLSTLHV